MPLDELQPDEPPLQQQIFLPTTLTSHLQQSLFLPQDSIEPLLTQPDVLPKLEHHLQVFDD